MDRVKIAFRFGDYERIAYLDVEDGLKVACVLDDLFGDFDFQSDRVFYRYNDNTLHSVFFYTMVEKDAFGTDFVRYRAVINDGKLVSN